jgi:murein DD-endopeptidase MepM/ murein hydrolase activator NlpD
MLRIPPVHHIFAVLMFLVPASAGAADAEGLPDGSDDAFRQRMLAWSEPAQATAAQAPPLPEPPAIETRQTLPYLSSRFGLRADPLHGGSRMHEGIDIPGALGSTILAAESGTVTFAGSAGGYGLLVEVDHGYGLKTRYAHLSRLLVGRGAKVLRQGAIGLMGSTGRSTGSHLHFEVVRYGRQVDPLAFLGQATSPDEYSRPGRSPFIGETAPVHISRFAQDRAASAQTSNKDCATEGCPD